MTSGNGLGTSASETPTNEDVSRRDLVLKLLGAAAGGVALEALAGCANPVESPESIAEVTQAFNGTSIRWADTVFGSGGPTNRVLGDLYKTSAQTGGAIVLVVKGGWVAGDGGGGVFYWDAGTGNVDDGGTVVVPGGSETGRTGAAWRRIYAGPLNVRWFGAKGDGATPDDIAIQRALSAAAVGTTKAVSVPAGTYLVTATLLVSSYTSLVGEGRKSILRRGPSLGDAVVKNSHYAQNVGIFDPSQWTEDVNLELRNLAIDGAKVVPDWRSSLDGIVLSRCTQVVVDNVDVFNCTNDAIILEFCRYGSVRNCRVTDNNKAGIYLSGSDYCQVLNNIARGNWGGVAVAASFYCVIIGNVSVHGTAAPGSPIPSFGVGTGRDTESSVFSNNIAQGFGVTPEALGVQLPFAADHPAGEPFNSGNPKVQGMYRCTVVDNIVLDYQGYGFHIAESNQNLLQGNQVFECGSSVRFAGASANTFKANQVYRNYEAGNPTSVGLLVQPGDFYQTPSSDNVFDGNFLYDDRTGPPRMTGVFLDPTSTSNLVSHNRIEVDTPIYASTGDTIYHGNALGVPPTTLAVLSAAPAPSVRNARVCKVQFASPTTITDLADGREGQEVLLVVANPAALTINDGGNFQLAGNATFVGALGSSISLVRVGTTWYETGRSVT